MRNSYFMLLGILFLLSSFQQDHTTEFHSEKVTLSNEETALYELIMEYRKKHKLPAIPLSPSLTFVAQVHVKDLMINKPDLSPECNAHSWSDQGKWTSCCYTSDHAKSKCMWNKPRELTSYLGTGYEISCGSSEPQYAGFEMTAQYALKGWQNSTGHNNVVLNKSAWKSREWKAIGIGIYEGFACVWFGEEEDPAGVIKIKR